MKGKMSPNRGGNFSYPGKGGQSVSHQKYGEKDHFVEGFGDSKVHDVATKDGKSTGVVHSNVKTDRGTFKRK